MMRDRDLRREQCIQRHIPILSKQTQDVLDEYLQALQPKTIVEIGSAVGYSTARIASRIAARNGKIYSYEVTYAAYREALQNTTNDPQVTIYPWSILDSDPTKQIASPVDFVFVDGKKAEYAQYVTKIQPLLHAKSIVVCDDVIKYQNKLTPLYEYIAEKQIIYHIRETEPGDGVMILQLPT